ncbi:MAG: (d)CMP kinase [Candidatus Thorarchaeota archaeon]|jgi:cytidylate kinase
MKRVITIGGLHGTGKSSVADIIAKAFKLRRVSAGGIFRELAKERGLTLEEFSRLAETDESIDRDLDGRSKSEAEKGNCMLDGQLAAWMARNNADLKILLIAPLETRIKRISDRDGVDFEHARRETVVREQIEKDRYLEFYGVDISDTSIYDLVINTDKFDLDGVAAIISAAIQSLFTKKE